MASVINLLVNARDNTGRALASAARGVRRMTTDADSRFNRLGNRIGDNINRGLRRAFGTGMTGHLGRGIRNAFRNARQAFSDGMANGIGNGLRTAMSNPYVAAAVVGLAVGLASMLGAAIAGVLVGVIGGAFVGLGVLAAFQSKNVKDKWKKTLSELKPLFADSATGMLPVIERARQQLIRLAKDFAPHFKTALIEAGPAVQTFMDYIIKGFERLGKTAAGPLESGFRTLLAALGPMLEDTLAGMGDSLAALGRTVGDHATEIAMAINGIIGLITTCIDIINFFANVWVTGIHSAGTAIGWLLGVVAMMVDGVLAGFEKILGAADFAFGWVPGVGSKFKDAQRAVHTFRETATDDLRALGQRISDTGKNLDRMNRIRRLEVDIKSWSSKLATAKAQLHSVPKSKQAAVRANIADLQAKVRQAKVELAMLHDKVVNVTVRNLYDSSLNRHANGGVVGRAASGGVRSNMTLVGEQGPEIINTPAGSHIRTNSDSRRIMNRSGGGTSMPPFVILLDVGGSRLAELQIDPIRKIVKSRGGVRATFGEL